MVKSNALHVRVLSCLVVLSALMLASCGGSSDETHIQDVEPRPPQIEPQRSPLPTLGLHDYAQSPVFYEGARLHVGTDMSPARSLPAVPERPGTFYGQVRDGEGAGSVARYLVDHAGVGAFKGFDGLETFRSAPTIHIARGASNELVDHVVRAVQLINENLPTSWHVRIGPEVEPLSRGLPDDAIYVDFARGDA